ncbi:MAG: hypothetical protein AAB575_00780 [Patescibacteria group bacterium]
MKIYEKLGFPTTLPDVDDVVVVYWNDSESKTLRWFATRVRSIHFHALCPDKLCFSLDVSLEMEGVEFITYDKKEGKYLIELQNALVEATVTFYE